jgi:hypothetical protein
MLGKRWIEEEVEGVDWIFWRGGGEVLGEEENDCCFMREVEGGSISSVEEGGEL